MGKPIEITPELLAGIEAKAESVLDYKAIGSPSYNELAMIEMAFHEKANPAVVLAMIERIRQLEAAQCWAIVTIETGVVDGPYATFEAAENERLAELCDDPDEPMYRVESWKGGAE